LSNVIAIIVLSGVACLSQVEGSDVLKITIVQKSKVPCAVAIREPAPEADVAQPEAKPAPKAAKSRCKAGKPVWYTNKRGKRRYRCQ